MSAKPPLENPPDSGSALRGEYHHKLHVMVANMLRPIMSQETADAGFADFVAGAIEQQFVLIDRDSFPNGVPEPPTRTTPLNLADQPNSNPNFPQSGNENIDNYLRQALNIAWVMLGGGPLEESKAYVSKRLENITSWADSPQPEAFPFVQNGGIQEGE
jgi:hypothetical protein